MLTNKHQKIAVRITRLLEALTALPVHSVRYALGEVGPQLHRVDPAELDWLVRVVAPPQVENGDAIYALQPLPKILVDAGVTTHNADQHAIVIAKTIEQHLRSVAASVTQNRALKVASILRELVSVTHHLEPTDEPSTEQLGGSATWTSAGARIMFSPHADGPIYSAWVTSNLEWILPYDDGLWRHLAYCVNEGVRPLIVARKIAFSTFPLLKRLGAFGIQYYQLPFPDTEALDDRNVERAFPMGPKVVTLSSIMEHEAFRTILPQQFTSARKLQSNQERAIQLANEIGLTVSETSGPQLLRRWTSQSGIEMPRPWKAQVTRYVKWHQITSGAD